MHTKIYDAGGSNLLGTLVKNGLNSASQWHLYRIEIRVRTSHPIHASGITRGPVIDSNPIAPSVSYTDLETGSLALQVFGADDNDIPYTVPGTLTSRFNDSVSTTGGAGGDKAVSGTGSTGTASFTMDANEQWVAVTVVVEAEAEAPPPPPTGEMEVIIISQK